MRNPTQHTMLAALLLLALALCSGQTPEPQPDLKTAVAVPVKYYLSLPEGWTADKSWPILVTLDGSGHQFLDNCQAFVRARGKQLFLIVTPCVSSNGNDPADARAVLSIVSALDDQWNDALRIAHDHGYTNIDRTTVAGSGHSA